MMISLWDSDQDSFVGQRSLHGTVIKTFSWDSDQICLFYNITVP